MNKDTLQALILENSHDELSKVHGHVYQVWEDGEITLQKSGDLLWQRGLHSIRPGDMNSSVEISLFPHTTSGHGYIFTDEKGARIVQNAIFELSKTTKSQEFLAHEAHANYVEEFINFVKEKKNERENS